MSCSVMPCPTPRKRPAPGTAPIMPLSQVQRPFSPAVAEQALRWPVGGDGGVHVDAGPRSISPFGIMPSPTTTTTTTSSLGPVMATSAAPHSTALARRQQNQALVPVGSLSQPFSPGSEQWPSFGDSLTPRLNANMDEHASIEQLLERAKVAEAEAKSTRKHIPPFVQKLRKFLDDKEARNAHLIRWSKDGDSFIVENEAEFAETLIPEMFKHNKYSSFVRQLNMYGFHKRVGLSDNSMKASERKDKSQSEYSNPYFHRGRPKLMWLINKSKSGSGKKKGKKDEAEGESDDDGILGEALPNLSHGTGGVAGVAGVAGIAGVAGGRANVGPGELSTLQKKDLVAVKSQLDRLQQQQMAISDMITSLRQEHAHLYQLLQVYESKFERHETSINTIMSFLSTIFKKSNPTGNPNAQEILASFLPHAQGAHNHHKQSHQMPKGSVVDLSDFIHQQAADGSASMNPPKRQQRLLPPIPPQQSTTPGTLSPMRDPAPTPAPSTASITTFAGQQCPTGTMAEFYDGSSATRPTPTPAFVKDELEAQARESMTEMIEDTNASAKQLAIDFQAFDGKTLGTLSSDQDTRAINFITGNGAAPSQTVPTTTSHAAAPATMASVSLSPMVNPVKHAASPMPDGLPNLGGASQSPPRTSLTPPPLSLFNMLGAEQNKFHKLDQLTNDTNDGIHRLTDYLGPLSPSGCLPGLDEHQNLYGSAPEDHDYFGAATYSHSDGNPDLFMDPNLYVPGTAAAGGMFNAGAFGALNTDGNDFNFSLDGSGMDGRVGTVPLGGSNEVAGAVEYLANTGSGTASAGAASNGVASAVATPSAGSSGGTEEIPRTKFDLPERESKRRRVD